jgi:hypothetical protein
MRELVKVFRALSDETRLRIVTTGIGTIDIGIASVVDLALYFHHPDSEVAALSGSRSSGKACW